VSSIRYISLADISRHVLLTNCG